MLGMPPERKALVAAYRKANPTECIEIQRLRDVAERSRAVAVEAQRALAEARSREHEAQLEVKRAKAARARLQSRIRFAEMQRQQLCEELDAAEWQYEIQNLQESAERSAA